MDPLQMLQVVLFDSKIFCVLDLSVLCCLHPADDNYIKAAKLTELDKFLS
jgi:hypothetical protein